MSAPTRPLLTGSRAEVALAAQFLDEVSHKRLPMFEREHRFAPPRRWRFDFAFVADKFAVEVEGGTWTNGRHNRGDGFEKDCAKYAEALLRGWSVLRVPTAWAMDGRALELVRRWFATGG